MKLNGFSWHKKQRQNFVRLIICSDFSASKAKCQLPIHIMLISILSSSKGPNLIQLARNSLNSNYLALGSLSGGKASLHLLVFFSMERAGLERRDGAYQGGNWGPVVSEKIVERVRELLQTETALSICAASHRSVFFPTTLHRTLRNFLCFFLTSCKVCELWVRLIEKIVSILRNISVHLLTGTQNSYRKRPFLLNPYFVRMLPSTNRMWEVMAVNVQMSIIQCLLIVPVLECNAQFHKKEP